MRERVGKMSDGQLNASAVILAAFILGFLTLAGILLAPQCDNSSPDAASLLPSTRSEGTLIPPKSPESTVETTPVPGSAEDFAARGQTYFNDRKYYYALRNFDAAIAKRNTFWPAYLGRGQAYAMLVATSEAQQDLKTYIEKSPQDCDGYFWMAHVFFYLLNDYDKAVDQYTTVVALCPSADAFENRGDAQLFAGNYDSAVADLTRALDLDPGRTNANKLRADAYRSLGRYEEAIGDYTQLLLAAPFNENSLYWRAFCYEKTGQIDQAVADLQLAVRVDPADEDAAAMLQRLTSH